MAKRPSTPVDEQPTDHRTARAAARRPPGDGHLPGDDRPAPGRPREERQRAQRRGRRRRAHRAGHPAPGRAGGHRRPVRALRRSARWPRSPRSCSSRTGPSGPSSRARRACASSASPRPSPYLRATIEELTDDSPGGLEVQALMRTVQAQIEQYVANGAPVPPEAAVAARNITEPGLLADMVAYSPDMSTEQRQELLETIDVVERLKLVSNFLGTPDRDPRAEGSDPVRGQVRDGQDPARVHPARAAQGDPARAGRGRPAAGRDQRAAREGRSGRHAGRDQGPGDQGSRPDEPDPVRVARGRRHPDLRGLAGRPAVERRRPTTSSTSRKPPASSTRTTTASRRSRSASSSTSPCAPSPTRSAARSSPSSDRPASARRRSARASRGRWVASSCG